MTSNIFFPFFQTAQFWDCKVSSVIVYKNLIINVLNKLVKLNVTEECYRVWCVCVCWALYILPIEHSKLVDCGVCDLVILSVFVYLSIYLSVCLFRGWFCVSVVFCGGAELCNSFVIICIWRNRANTTNWPWQ